MLVFDRLNRRLDVWLNSEAEEPILILQYRVTRAQKAITAFTGHACTTTELNGMTKVFERDEFPSVTVMLSCATSKTIADVGAFVDVIRKWASRYGEVYASVTSDAIYYADGVLLANVSIRGNDVIFTRS